MMHKTVYHFLLGTLRGRLIISVALVHALMMTLFIYDLTVRQRAMLLNLQTEEATALCQALATTAAEWIAADDISGLQELVVAQQRYPEIIFALLTDENGRILASTDRSQQGLYLLDLPREARQTLISESSALVDIAVPALVGKHHVGWSRVGIGQKMASERLAEITRDGVLYALVAILLGSIIAWRMGRRITDRLYAVQKTMDAIRSGDRLARAQVAGNDEPAVMAHEFNAMLDAIAERDLELQASEQRFRSLMRKVQTAIVLHDGRGHLLESNPMAQDLLGLSADQLLGKALIDPDWHFLRGDGSVMSVAEYPVSQVLATGQSLKGYLTGISRPDLEGVTWVLVNGEPEYDEAGEIARVIVSFVDITERKRAEEENTWNLALNQALASLFSPLAAAGTDIERIAGIILEKSRHLTGSAHGIVAEIDPATGDLIAHTLTVMIPTECKIVEERFRKIRFQRRADGLYHGLLGHALNTGESFYTQAPLQHPASAGIPEGHLPIESFLAVPVLLGDELVGQIALSNSSRAYTDRDLQAIKRIAEFYALAIQRTRAEKEIGELNLELERRVQERTAQLETANQELEAFAYSVSHDLRAPLRHLDGYAELLVSRCRDELSDQGLHYIDTIAASARQMGVLIDDLLQFSRTGRAELRQEKIDMNLALREALAPVQEASAGRAIEWVIGELPPVRGDFALLRQVWTNLLGNAIKYTQTRKEARIEVGTLEADGETVFFIADNGVGFDMQYAGKLFGVFQRLHSQEEFEGTGIGLATVQRIIARHGGRVWAEAEVDRGARFSFSLPAARGKPHH